LPQHAPNTCIVLATPNRRPGLRHSVAGCGRRSAPASLRSTATAIVSCRAPSYRQLVSLRSHFQPGEPTADDDERGESLAIVSIVGRAGELQLAQNALPQ
jgi:hypothetical protein